MFKKWLGWLGWLSPAGFRLPCPDNLSLCAMSFVNREDLYNLLLDFILSDLHIENFFISYILFLGEHHRIGIPESNIYVYKMVYNVICPQQFP
jgi:hypothetical protein